LPARGRPSTGDAASSIRHAVSPRDVPPEKAARRLHLTLAQFQVALPELQARGFPKPDPTTGMYDLVAIDRWMDARSGLGPGLTAGTTPRNAHEVFSAREARLLNG
jgi:hypothetical protein